LVRKWSTIINSVRYEREICVRRETETEPAGRGNRVCVISRMAFRPSYSLPSHVEVQTGKIEKNVRWTLIHFDSGNGRSVCEDNVLCATLRPRFSTQALRYARFEQENNFFRLSPFNLSSDVHRPCAIPLSRPAMQSPMQLGERMTAMV